MALLDTKRISSFVLVDAVGIEVPGHPIADFFSLTLKQVAELSYHDPFIPQWHVNSEGGVSALTSVEDPYVAAGSVDVVVLLQPHAIYDCIRLASVSPLVLDTRGVMKPSMTVQRL